MADQFADLQKAFFAAFIQGVGYSINQPAVVVQPSPPVVGEDDDEADTLLWNYFNTIPPYSLTMNTTLASGAQYLSNYSAVMSSLQSPPNNFESTIGEFCFDAYNAAVAGGNAEPTPTGYRNWAMFTAKCSQNAVAGASALAAALLDPIFAAQMNVMPYKPVGKKSVNFVPGYATMKKQLKAAPSRSFSGSISATSSDYSKTWTGGSQSAVFGLWSNSYSDTRISQTFSSQSVSLNATFKNLLPFVANPGDWYTSSAFGIAYSEKGTPPWSPNGLKTWDNTFSQNNGNMTRFLTTLLIANEMTLNYTTDAVFSQSDQEEIKKNSSAGLWPFYNSNSGSYSNTVVTFDTSGHMMVTTTTAKNVPTIIGATIEPVESYLGTLQAASKLEFERVYARHGKK